MFYAKIFATFVQMKKKDLFLSYLYPVVIEVEHSSYNPVLEIVLYSGKYSLNSENTNYSFGTLHTLFKRVFRRLKLNWKEISNVLILGFGTGSVARIIRTYNADCNIDGVEIDEKIIGLGEKYFNTGSLENLIIHCAPAKRYLESCNREFDLIVIDVYVDMIVPPEMESEDFIYDVWKALRPGGIVIFNKAIYSKSISEQLPGIRDIYKKTFGNIQIITVMNSGKIFIAKKETSDC
jgi:spermidine synthase